MALRPWGRLGAGGLHCGHSDFGFGLASGLEIRLLSFWFPASHDRSWRSPEGFRLAFYACRMYVLPGFIFPLLILVLNRETCLASALPLGYDSRLAIPLLNGKAARLTPKS